MCSNEMFTLYGTAGPINSKVMYITIVEFYLFFIELSNTSTVFFFIKTWDTFLNSHYSDTFMYVHVS